MVVYLQVELALKRILKRILDSQSRALPSVCLAFLATEQMTANERSDSTRYWHRLFSALSAKCGGLFEEGLWLAKMD
jgi:hypothetical protein